ncbi:MAG TPA: hypothetical protein VGO62_21905, partial [Myxococcota bacterium]
MDRSLRILVQRGLVPVPTAAASSSSAVDKNVLATVMNNVCAYGYALARDAFVAVRAAGDADVRWWWEQLEEVLADLTGANRKMEQHVVYQNFPHEVLRMDEADYWLRQILMYWGLPNDLFTEPAAPRAPIDDKEALKQKVLQPVTSPRAALDKIRADLFRQTTRFTGEQKTDALHLFDELVDTARTIDLADMSFKENMVALAVHCLARGVATSVDTATDVIRLAIGMSGGDVSMAEPTKLRRFSRTERRFLLGLLERSKNLDDDVARRPELMKRLAHALHAGDYGDRYARVVASFHKLYRDELPQTLSAKLEQRLRSKDVHLLHDLEAKPGEFMRRLHQMLLLFGEAAVRSFVGVLPRLTVHQLVKTERYLAKVNERAFRTFPPKNDWGKLQVVPADPQRRLSAHHLKPLLHAIGTELGARVSKRAPVVALARTAELVKLPSSDSQLLPYGRGTVFPLPTDARFIRTASYWSTKTRGNSWFDNGWNFFKDGWVDAGACCWSAPQLKQGKHTGAVFSGDPTNSKDLEGRACQLIDLYPEQLADMGVRFAVWNVLCYSRITFDEATEVFAGLLWGKDPAQGKLFDPSRVQLAFPITGNQYTKYIAIFDVKYRHIIYADANLRASTSSASANGARLSKVMPAFMEYLDSLPSVHDLFAHAPQSPDGMPVIYSDAAVTIRDREAFVFKPENEANRFTPFA